MQDNPNHMQDFIGFIQPIDFIGEGGGSTPPTPEALAYQEAVAAQGGTLSPTELTAVNAFIVRTQASGKWSKIVAMNPWLGGTPGVSLAGIRAKLKYPVGGNPLDTLASFVAADLTTKGLKSDGVNKDLNTEVTINQATSTGPMGNAVFLTEEITQVNDATIMGTSAGGNPQVSLRWNVDGQNVIDSLMGGVGAATAKMTNSHSKVPVGLLHAQRLGNNNSIYAGGIPVASANSGFTYAGSGDRIHVFSADWGNRAAMTAGLYMVLDGTVTADDALELASAANELMVSLGRVVPLAKPLNYLPIVGQSNATGTGGTPPTSTTQPYSNLIANGSGNPGSDMPGYFTNSGQGAQPGVLVGMVEGPNETISSAFANTVAMYARAAGMGAAWDSITHNFGIGATPYSGLKKGTTPYANSLAVLNALKQPRPLYATGGLRAPAGLCVLGESDVNSLDFGLDMREFQADLQADHHAITGETGLMPLLHVQTSSWTSPDNVNQANAIAPFALLAEAILNPHLTMLVAAAYYPEYDDGVHRNTAGHIWVGEQMAKAFWQQVVLGIPWAALRITNVVRVGATLHCTTNAATQLVLDTSIVSDPSGNNTKGLEWSASGTSTANRYTAISSVTVTGVNTFDVVLVSNPDGQGDMLLSYAFTGIPGNSAGPMTGPRGCIRDSDTRLGYSGNVLHNYALHQRVPVT